MEITISEDDFLAIYDTFAVQYIEGADPFEAEGDEFKRLMDLEDRAWRVVQKLYAQHYSNVTK